MSIGKGSKNQHHRKRYLNPTSMGRGCSMVTVYTIKGPSLPVRAEGGLDASAEPP